MTIRRRVLTFAFAVALPLLALSLAVLGMYDRANRDAAEDRLVGQARSMALLLDREFASATQALQSLAGSQALGRRDLDGFRLEMRAAAAAFGAEGISLAGPDGRVLLSTLWPSAAPPGDVFATPEAQGVIASGRPAISNLFVSPTTYRHAISVLFPFEAALAGPPAQHLLGLLLPRESLLHSLLEQRLPAGAYASVIDRDMVLVARTLRFEATLGSPARPEVAAITTGEEGIARYTDLEGTPVVSAFARAPISGYRTRISVPESSFLAPLHSALLRAAGIGALLLAGSVAMALLLARRIAASLRFLTPGGAAAFAAPGIGRSGLSEVDDLARALARASAERDTALAELRMLYATSPVGMAQADTGGRVRSANDAFLRLIGRTRADLDDKPLRLDTITPPEWLARDEAGIAEAVRRGSCTPYEKEYLRTDGTRVPVLVAFGLLDKATGRCAAFAVDLTDRKRAEDTLAENQAQLALAQEAGGVGLWSLDTGTDAFIGSAACLGLTGLDQRTLTTGVPFATVLALVVEADRDRVASAARQAAATGAALDLDFRIHRADSGALRWIHVQARRVPGSTPARLTGAARDVTERREAQAALQHRHDTLNALVTSDVVGITVTTGTRIEEANDHFLRLVGRSRAELEAGSIDWAALTPPEHAAADAAMMRHMAETGTSQAYEKEYLRPDGTRVPVLIGSGVIDRATLRRIVFAVDLTERRRAEAEAREADLMLRTILESCQDRVAVLDGDGRFVFVNRAGLEHLGIDDKARLGRSRWQDRWTAGQAESAQAAVAEAAAGRSARFTGMMPNARGEHLWWDVLVSPLRGAGDRPGQILAVARDITSGHAAVDMANQLNARLEATVAESTRALSDSATELAAVLGRREEAQVALLQAQKLEALGQLTSGVAHDFNNMLAAIQGSFTLLTKRVHDDMGQRLIRNGRQASERAAGLIRHLLAFARQEEVQPAVVDPGALLPDVGELLRQAVGRKVTLVLEPPPASTWRVLVEPHQLEVALLNLGVNARDAMPEGGTLTLAVRNLPADAAGRPAGLADGDHVVLAMRDTGTGMPPEVLARATEAFFTTKELGRGTGLGLAMVQRMAQQLGGMLHIESTVGQGTTMSIILPRAETPLADAPTAATDIEQVQHGDATILVVDDDPQVRVVTASFLRDLHYTVIEAASAAAGYAMAQASGELDLVVTDVAMPGADGPSLAARLRADWPDLPIIFVTGFAADAVLEGETVLPKPYAFPELAALIAERLHRDDSTRRTAGP